jgi:hypothetical protein
VQELLKTIKLEFKRAENKLRHQPDGYVTKGKLLPSGFVPNQLSTIYDLVHDIRLIVGRMQVS